MTRGTERGVRRAFKLDNIWARLKYDSRFLDLLISVLGYASLQVSAVTGEIYSAVLFIKVNLKSVATENLF